LKVRIAFDSQTFCNQSYGGISRYFVRLAEQLIFRNHDVCIFAPLHRNRYVKDLSSGIVQGYGLNNYMPKTSRLMFLLNHFLSRIAIKHWQPQIVHETYYSTIGSAPKDCPTVITVYDMIHELFEKQFSSRDHTSRLKKISVKRADHIICISESTRQDLIQLLGVDEKKVSVVYLGFEKFSTDSKKQKKISAINKPYLFFVGDRGNYKNFLRFIHAIGSSKRLKNEFNIICFGGGRFVSSELAIFSELGFKKDQVIHKEGDDILLGECYDHATAFVYPSLYEGFGLPPLEAMAHNCPVISSNTSSMPEIIGDAAEFFDPKSIEDISASIERVVYSPNRTNTLIKQGEKRLTNYSWELCATQTLQIYSSLCG